jgi:hypothetical protein
MCRHDDAEHVVAAHLEQRVEPFRVLAPLKG